MPGLSYLGFHAVFVVPPLVALGAARRARSHRDIRVGIAVITVVALAYTTPWDNLLVAHGVWSYGDEAVVATLWHAPVEEYLFIALQPVLTGLWVAGLPWATIPPASVARRERAIGVFAGAAVGVVGVALLVRPATRYLGAILAWAGPVLALQWGVGWPVVWARRRTVALGVALPTLYLCVADRIAIDLGVWTLADQYTTGVAVAGLPVEEGLFFLVTNLFVVQGLVLYDWVVSGWR
jgi:lycopene cyclase domain-containing protein